MLPRGTVRGQVQAVKNELLLAGYPKSGNTWCGYILCHLLGAKYVDLHKPHEPPTADPRVRQLTGWQNSIPCQLPIFAKTHSLPTDPKMLEDYPRRALIVRDPRDVAVSAYHYYQNLRHQQRTHSPARQYNRCGAYVRFKRNLLTVAREWPEHTRAWLDVDGIVVIRYEDLLTDTVDSISRLAEMLKIKVDLPAVEESVSHFTFESLSGGRISGQAQNNSFFRKGVSGDYRNYFGPIDHCLFAGLVPSDLRKRFYG